MRDDGRAAEYVDDRDLQRLTSIKRVTWQLMRAKGNGPRWFKIGRRCLYKLVEVRQWIEQHARDGESPPGARIRR
jgi:hypothetical protein